MGTKVVPALKTELIDHINHLSEKKPASPHIDHTEGYKAAIDKLELTEEQLNEVINIMRDTTDYISQRAYYNEVIKSIDVKINLVRGANMTMTWNMPEKEDNEE